MEHTGGKEVRHEVWRGAIPLRVSLASSEVTTLTAPPPLHLMAARNGYLPFLVDRIGPHFQAALPPGEDTVWFDFQGLPLKWHIPVGVLYDLLCPAQQLPWNITVHYRAYPSDVLLPLEGAQESVKTSYFSSLKEAVYAMHGSTKLVMGLSQAEQGELWRAVLAGDGGAHERLTARVWSGGSLSSSMAAAGSVPPWRDRSGSSAPSRLPRIPLRIYLRAWDGQLAGPEDRAGLQWEDLGMLTRCVEPPKAAVYTLDDCLQQAVPDLLPFLHQPKAREPQPPSAPSLAMAMGEGPRSPQLQEGPLPRTPSGEEAAGQGFAKTAKESLGERGSQGSAVQSDVERPKLHESQGGSQEEDLGKGGDGEGEEEEEEGAGASSRGSLAEPTERGNETETPAGLSLARETSVEGEKEAPGAGAMAAWSTTRGSSSGASGECEASQSLEARQLSSRSSDSGSLGGSIGGSRDGGGGAIEGAGQERDKAEPGALEEALHVEYSESCGRPQKNEDVQIRVQGLDLMLETPLDWVARNLSAPDLFVHLCIITSSPHRETGVS